MEITLDYIAQRYQHFNELCFAGQLAMPPMRLSRARRTLGQVAYRKRRRLFGGWKYSDITFAISAPAVRDMTAEQVDDIILHEMIHYYILSNQMQDTSAHGRLFRREMQRINNATGSHITITYRARQTDVRPILGDALYGQPADRLHLHADRLEFTHPATNERMFFDS